MTRVRFEDVVKRANTKEDKDNTDKIYYVGGEHIITDEVLVEDRGVIKGSTIGSAFYFGFKAGQVLFVSRSPDLKKCGMVTFDGICSEKTFVLETKDESVLLQRFLPFVMRSDRFWNYIDVNKSGSVNYFTNWSTLANYEFNLPPIEEQARIADLLWGMNDTKKAYRNLLAATDELVKARFVEMFGNPISNDKCWNTEHLENVAPIVSQPIPENNRYWLLNLDMIESFSGRILDKVFVNVEEIGNSTFPFDDSMVLYSKLRPYLNKVVIPKEYGYATTELVGMKPNEKILNKVFLFNLLRGDEFVKFANEVSAGARMPRIPMEILRNFPCILPPMKLQIDFVDFYENIETSSHSIRRCLDHIGLLLKVCLNDYLQG